MYFGLFYVCAVLCVELTVGLPKIQRDVVTDPTPEKTTTGIARGGWNSVLIVPGTKWCGLGNNALDYNTLGYANETDACCRTHDHCDMYLSGLKTKYNFYNRKPWTLVSCECDTAFYNCLMNVGNDAAHTVGIGFFDVLKVSCMNIEIGRYCEKYAWHQLSCDKYAIGPVATLNPIYAGTFNKNFQRRHKNKVV